MMISALKSERTGRFRHDSWFGVPDYDMMFPHEQVGPWQAEHHTTWRFGPLTVSRTRSPSFVLGLSMSPDGRTEEVRHEADTRWQVKFDWSA